jgi:hypothetical protein
LQSNRTGLPLTLACIKAIGVCVGGGGGIRGGAGKHCLTSCCGALGCNSEDFFLLGISTRESIPPDTLDPEVHADLIQQLELNQKKIENQYVFFVNHVRQSMIQKKVEAEELCAYLLSLPAFNSGHTEQEFALLSDVSDHLEKATTINDIFNILNRKYGASFINYEIFEEMAKYYDIKQDTEYSEHLDAYIKMHKLSEFEHINPKLNEFHGKSKKMILKFDIDRTCRLAMIQDLKKAVANVLRLKVSALRLLSIEDGCIVVTFLIPSVVADYLFNSKSVLTIEDSKEFQTLSVSWLTCNDQVYQFSTLPVDDTSQYHTTSISVAGMLFIAYFHQCTYWI